MEKVLVILGPTAAGKTKLSLELAKNFRGEIISADSMQVYRGMDIGTAKAGKEERESVPHHLLDVVSPEEKFSVADYQEMVDQIIPGIVEKGRIPMLVGGTGLYIKAVIEGFLFPEMDNDYKLRNQLKKLAETHGNKYLHNKLTDIDPQLAEKIHPNDLRRVIRGIEVYKKTGKTITYYKKKQQQSPDRYLSLKFGLTWNRDDLYQRINQRVDQMIEKGLVDEVKGLLNSGYNLSKTARQGLGYKEIIDYLEGEYALDEAVRLLKRNTRRFAKRQLTWFKRDDSINWFNFSELEWREVFNKTLELTRDFFDL